MPSVDRIIKELWDAPKGKPAPEVYAVLDGARDPRIHRMIRFGVVDYVCLYSGELPPALQEVAPYLLHLGSGARLTREIVDKGWGKSWGIFLTSTRPMGVLRRHLKEFLRVKDEDGKRLVFRYYDPRVLRVFLPTCMPEELERFYGPIDRFIAEGDDPEMMLRYTDAGGELATDIVDLAAPLPAPVPSLPTPPPTADSVLEGKP